MHAIMCGCALLLWQHTVWQNAGCGHVGMTRCWLSMDAKLEHFMHVCAVWMPSWSTSGSRCRPVMPRQGTWLWQRLHSRPPWPRMCTWQQASGQGRHTGHGGQGGHNGQPSVVRAFQNLWRQSGTRHACHSTCMPLDMHADEACRSYPGPTRPHQAPPGPTRPTRADRRALMGLQPIA